MINRQNSKQQSVGVNQLEVSKLYNTKVVNALATKNFCHESKHNIIKVNYFTQKIVINRYLQVKYFMNTQFMAC